MRSVVCIGVGGGATRRGDGLHTITITFLIGILILNVAILIRDKS